MTQLRIEIPVRLAQNQRRWISAVKVGNYAIHPKVGSHLGWSVTHIVSGFSVWQTFDEVGAAKVAMFLSRTNPLPLNATTLQEIMQKAPSNLGEQLSEIAPKYSPYMFEEDDDEEKF